MSSIYFLSDVTPPRVDECVSPPPFTLQDQGGGGAVGSGSGGRSLIDWHEPEFSDNSGDNLTITVSHERQDFFPVGTTDVVYTAYDKAGNNNTCVIHITVQGRNNQD